MTPHTWLWKSELFESFSLPQVSTSRTDSSWLVEVLGKDLAWGYCITLPQQSHADILWRARLEIRDTKGDVSPGIAFHDFNDGFLVQINAAHGTAELRYILTKQETVRMEIAEVGEIAGNYLLTLEYNALTCNCACCLDDNPLFEVKLPYKRIPALSSITALEIITTTPQDANGGFVKYGNLYLDSE